MDTFGFTQKKFISLSRTAQHQHTYRWLSSIYQRLTTNRIPPYSLENIAVQYNRILGWSSMIPFIAPDPKNTRAWVENISDRIHYHRCEAGLPSRDHDLLGNIRTEDLSTEAEIHRFDCHVALDGLRSLFNVGSIFRTCEAAGFKSIILGNTPGWEHPGVQKTAMGAQQWVGQEKTIDLAQTLVQKKEEGYKIIGIETIENACAFDNFQWEEKSIVVVGNEEYGISSHVIKMCDTCVQIPMFGKKNSINVANATAVICFHVARSLSSGSSPHA